MIKTNFSVHAKKAAIAIHDIESNAEMEFAKTDRAKRKWSGVAFAQMIGTIQDTLEEYAMMQREHVAHLVDEHFTASPQQDLLIVLASFLTVKGWIIARKAKYSDAFAQGGLPKDEIPRGVRIQILHGYGEDAEGIGGRILLEEG